MHYSNKLNLESLLILALIFLPITVAASNDLPQQVSQLQSQMMEANARITMLASEQQKTTSMISVMQTSLNTAHQQINDLNNRGAVKFKPSSVTGQAGVQRTANGRGRRKR